ncbi:MAG TPA: iron ABC transporter permease [Anaerolineaceae bacterium]|nr:iron ABC transporter permease [Anaerolineaceae bacterium]
MSAFAARLRTWAKNSTYRAVAFWLLPAIFLGYFFYQPLLALFNLLISPRWGFQFSDLNLQKIWAPLRFTVFQASLSTLLTLVIGLPGAWLFTHFSFPGKKALRTLTTLPFILPTVVVAAGFNALLGPRGWVNLGLMLLFNLQSPPIQFLNTFGAILTAHVFYNTTIVIRVVSNAWSQQNIRLTHAAKVLGASPWQTFKEVTLPLLKPSIYAATLLVFLFNFTSFGVVLMLGGPQYATLEVEIYIQALHLLNLPLASVLSILQLVCTLIITIAHRRLSGQQQALQISPRAQEVGVRKPKRGFEKVLVILLMISLFTLLIAPMASLALRSFVKLEANRGERGEIQRGFTLDYYKELGINRRGSLFYVPPIAAARNSFMFALITIVITLFFGLLVAYALQQNSPINNILDPLLMLPLGASAITLGLGFIIVFNRPPFSSLNFPILLPIAHSLVALPFVVRTLSPALQSIPYSLRSAAKVLGAPPFRVWREVDLPLMAPSILVGIIFALTISLGEFGASTFLSRPEYPTLPVAIFRYISQPGAMNYGQALAMSTILMVVCAVGILVIERLRLPGKDIF